MGPCTSMWRERERERERESVRPQKASICTVRSDLEAAIQQESQSFEGWSPSEGGRAAALGVSEGSLFAPSRLELACPAARVYACLDGHPRLPHEQQGDMIHTD